jgi:DNA-binding MarR family transcriptional regulator
MANPPWLDPEEQRAWRSYVRMQSHLQRRLGQQLQRDSGLSAADFEVLVNLSEAPAGRLRAYELSAELQWEKSRLSHHLTRMQKRGLIEREDCADDARGAFVVLTAEGRRTIEEAAPLHATEVRARVIDALGPERLRALDEICTTVLAALDDADAEPGAAAPE